MQAQQGVLEKKLSRGHLDLFEGQKGQRPLGFEQLKLKETKLMNTLEEYLCKECTRPTLRRSVERQPVEGQSKHKECGQRELVSS
jgi:hypothetical protein